MLTNIDLTKPVQVYRNLHKPGRIYSVRQGGRVRCYVDSIVLIDAKFKHATPKQLSEVRTGARQVCQWITGTVSDAAGWVIAGGNIKKVSCDPKTADGFIVDGKRIDTSPAVAIGSCGCFATV